MKHLLTIATATVFGLACTSVKPFRESSLRQRQLARQLPVPISLQAPLRMRTVVG